MPDRLYLRRETDNVYAVLLDDGARIGAIIRAGPTDARHWQWSITTGYATAHRSLLSGSGETTREAAMAAFRAAWGGAGVDMDAWRQHMRAVEGYKAAWEAIRRPK